MGTQEIQTCIDLRDLRAIKGLERGQLTELGLACGLDYYRSFIDDT